MEQNIQEPEMTIQKRNPENYRLTLIRNKTFLQNVFDTYSNAKNAYIIIPNLCNNSGTFSGPINAILKENFPASHLNYQLLTKKFLSDNSGYCQIVECKYDKKKNNKIFVANMIAQDTYRPLDPKRTLNYFYLMKAMYNIGVFIDKNIKETEGDVLFEIHSPKFGTGFPGGKWELIKDLMEDVWKYRNVHVYQNLK
jgi:hypothetical protein